MDERISSQISGLELLKASVDWCGQVSIAALSGKSLTVSTELKKAFQKFYEFYERIDDSNFIELKRLEDTFEKLCLSSTQPENHADFVGLFTVYSETLITIIKPVEVETTQLQGEGFEGLKSDFQQEMERLSRDGRDFCICLVKVCDQKTDNTELVYNLISSELRGFDRVFILENNDIAMSLKQTGKNGAGRFLKRVQNKILMDNNLNFNAVISQPVTGEILEVIVLNLKKDLDELHENVSGDIIVLQELSPLERHLKEVES